MRDDSHGVQLPGHRDEHREPQKGVPRALLLQRLVPGDDVHDHQQGEADHRRESGRDPNLGPEYPHEHRDGKTGNHLELVPPNGPELLQLFRCDDGRLRGLFHPWWIDQVDHDRGRQDPEDRRHTARDEPIHKRVREGDAHARGDLHAQKVLRRGADQEARGHVTALQLLRHQVRLGPIVEGVDDRHEHPGGSCRGARHRRRQDRLRRL
mmetsp:Transcript_185/g.792  ORF Transcript_185/g.792 Transcript_185/m.792 type:complete len:209 (-) Transcript_185:965-1591(-)